MTTAEAEARLKLALKNALMLDDNTSSIRSIADTIYDAERELIALLRRPWIVERMARMLRKMLKDAPSDRQPKLPGLDLLPVKIPVQNGEEKLQVALRNATLPQLLEYRKKLAEQIAERSQRKLQELDRLIAFMKKHAGRSPRRTVGQVMEQHEFEFMKS